MISKTIQELRRTLAKFRLQEKLLREEQILASISRTRAKRAENTRIQKENNKKRWLVSYTAWIEISPNSKALPRNRNKEPEADGVQLQSIYRTDSIKYPTNNHTYFEKYIVNHFDNVVGHTNGDYGHSTIRYIDINEVSLDPQTKDYADIPLRNSYSGFCVIDCIYQKIKSVEGYKNYTIQKIKDEFFELGINI